MGNLTDMEVKSLVKTGKSIAGKSDGNGLTFTLSARGTATWVFRYRFGGKQRELTIGSYPAISLKRARELATEKRAQVQQGIDVASVKQAQIIEQTMAKNVQQLCNEYFERMVLGRVKRPEFIRAIINNDLIRKLGRKPIAEVRPGDVDDLLREIVDRGAPVMANRTLSLIRAVFNYAIRRHLIEHNPASAFNRCDAGGQEKPRKRSLSNDELVRFFQAIREAGPTFRIYGLAIKLLLLTAVRKSELIEAPWSEFDLDESVWSLPAERTKTERDFVIPLPLIAVEWLQEIKRISVASKYVFPARRRSSKPTMSPETLNWALQSIGHDLESFTLHDLRRTARTHLSALGVLPHVAERCLNHKLPGINDIYDTHDYFAERRLALNAWADLLVQLDSGETGKVIPIKSKTVA